MKQAQIQTRQLSDALSTAMDDSVATTAVIEVRGPGNTVRATMGAQPEGLYAVGSPTKVMTSVMTLQLIQEGVIGLDDPIGTRLPDFRLDPRALSDRVTIRHLLTHSSGIDCADDLTETGEDDDALERFVKEVVAGSDFLHEPGLYWSYCNAGFSVLGRLIEAIDGRPWDDSFIARIAAPLGLAARPATRVTGGHIAQGHRVEPGVSGLIPENRLMGRNGGPAGSNMLATAADLAEFAFSLCDGRERLLSAVLASEMNRAHIQAPDRQQGFGWASTHPGFVSHQGITLGHTSFMAAFPSQRRTLGLTVNGPGALGIAERINQRLFAIDPISPPEAGPTTFPVAHYRGEYRRRHVTQQVEVSEGQLSATTHYFGAIGDYFPDPVPAELEPAGGNSFISRTGDDSPPATWLFQAVTEGGQPKLLMVANRLHARS